MRRILHISDLHFGRADDKLVTGLAAKIQQLKPDVIVVSGDLTQRARKHQFRQARKFLDSLRYPRIVVPGNHDVPLENLILRFFWPLARYRRFITDDLNPAFTDAELAIYGLNTARSLTWSSGSISRRQIEHARQFFCSVDRRLVKIVVTHHPFDFHAGRPERYLVRRARETIAALAACEADLYLAGHAHVPLARYSAHRYEVAHHTALIVQAGTSLSTRTRNEPNSFNLLHIHRPAIIVEQFHWNAPQFVSAGPIEFVHTSKGWHDASA